MNIAVGEKNDVQANMNKYLTTVKDFIDGLDR